MLSQTDSDERIAVVAGLGNPGNQYQLTRHNVGFHVVDLLARETGMEWRGGRFRALWGVAGIEGHNILLFKPQTFMNLSGEAVVEMLRHFEFSSRQVLVVHDDLDLPCGRIRLVRKGGAGGHRGISSLIQHLEQSDFPRLKLGIGRPLHGEPIESFVLHRPYPEDEEIFQHMVKLGAEAVRTVLRSGLGDAMNRYNRREPTSD